MLAKFDKIIRNDLQILKTDVILLAISGGIDSMVMAELCRGINQAIAIAHCNYQLRGTESDLDENFVRAYASQHNIQIHVRKFEINKSTGGVQEQARDLRYAWFNDLVVHHKYHYIATAHHMDDQLETFMINLIRGTGLEGLSGIHRQRHKIIRPMLTLNKSMIDAYAENNNIAYRLDQSNMANDYLRNRIRHHITPFIKNENPNFTDNFSRTLNKLGQAEKLYKKYISDHYQVINGSILLTELPHDSFELILFQLLKPYQVTWTQVENIHSAMYNSGSLFHTPNYTLLIDRNYLKIRAESIIDLPVITISELGTHNLGAFGRLEILEMMTYQSDLNPTFEFMDADLIEWPLTVRTWEKGDRFSPIGLHGKQQKIQDYFSNNKISRLDKKQIPILVDNQKIIWIMGHRLSESVKITKSTQRVIRFNYLSNSMT